MLKKEAQNKRLDKQVETQLLLQAYSRYVSRAHTIFETYFTVISMVIFSNIGLILSLIETKIIPFNKFYFIILAIIDLIIGIVITIMAISVWYDSRRKRASIVNEIKVLNTNSY